MANKPRLARRHSHQRTDQPESGTPPNLRLRAKGHTQRDHANAQGVALIAGRKRSSKSSIAYRALVLGTVRDSKRSYSLARRGCSSLKSLIGDLIVEDAFLANPTINRQIIHFLLLFGPPEGGRTFNEECASWFEGGAMVGSHFCHPLPRRVILAALDKTVDRADFLKLRGSISICSATRMSRGLYHTAQASRPSRSQAIPSSRTIRKKQKRAKSKHYGTR